MNYQTNYFNKNIYQYLQNSDLLVFTINKSEEKRLKSLITESIRASNKKQLLYELLSGIGSNKKNILREFKPDSKTFVVFVNSRSTPKEESKILLSEREKEILTELSLGKRYKEIAKSLFISVHTVKFYMKGIYKKFNIHSQSQAVSIAAKIGLI